MPDPLYQPVGNRFEPSPYVRGPWSFDHCHAGPPAGLLATALADGRPDMGMTRFTCEIPGPVPLAPVRIETSVVRSGRRISLLRAEMSGLDGTVFMFAHAWFMRLDDTVTGPVTAQTEPLPPRDHGEPFDLNFWGDEPDFSGCVEMLAVEGRPFTGFGSASVWARITKTLLPDRPWNPYARAVTIADFPNGIGAIGPMSELMAVNTDITVYFGRQPEQEWIGMRCSTNSSGLGLGTTQSLLYDMSGFVGTANQSIFFDRVTPPGTAG